MGCLVCFVRCLFVCVVFGFLVSFFNNCWSCLGLVIVLYFGVFVVGYFGIGGAGFFCDGLLGFIVVKWLV